jgi:hypothetical protein
MHVVDYFIWRLEQVHSVSVQPAKEKKHMYVGMGLKLLNHKEKSGWMLLGKSVNVDIN